MMERTKLEIDRLLAEKHQVLVAIDGSCTAGKTTLAAELQEIYDCNVFHMDDFFLRPHQRTPERFAETGGNVDYERFFEEVLMPLRDGGAFSYRPFSCRRFEMAEPVAVQPKRLNIIEGSYSQHPYFGDVYDLKIYLTITPELRQLRLQDRPAPLQERFRREWIPMEQRYFQEMDIAERADLIL